MSIPETFEIFLAAPPGLEETLRDEAREAGFAAPEVVPGGVTVQGGWPDVWRANVELRGAGRVLARIASFMAFHPAQLDKRARKVAWGDVLRPDVPVRVEATCRKSKIYHAGAAEERIGRAIAETLGAPVAADAEVVLRVRIDDNRVTISVDTSGAPLHRRGHKEEVGKAPLRETLAALFLRRCGYTGSEPVVDPMCGSGTFVLEAAEIAAGLPPGRTRAFAFERLATADPAGLAELRARRGPPPAVRFLGADRDAGAVRMSRSNAERAGVAEICTFLEQSVSALAPPEGSPGLVMVNPPYGGRIGNRKLLYAIYASLGSTLTERFSGWRVGLVTSDAGLARSTGLPFVPGAPTVPHGGLKVTLHTTGPLP